MKRSIGVSSPVSYCASRLPPSSHRTYVALLIKWRSVLRIFTAAPMSLTPARPAPEAPAAEPVGESSPPPSPTGGASPTTPPDPQPKQTEPEQADPQPKRLEPDPKLGTRTQSQSRRRRLGRAEKGEAAASTLAVDYSDGRGPNGCGMAQYVRIQMATIAQSSAMPQMPAHVMVMQRLPRPRSRSWGYGGTFPRRHSSRSARRRSRTGTRA